MPFQGHSDAVRSSDSTKKHVTFYIKSNIQYQIFSDFETIIYARQENSAITQPISTKFPTPWGCRPLPFSVGWSKGGQRSPANLPTAGFKEVPGPGLGSSGKDDHE